jgi:SnoaL-like domain
METDAAGLQTLLAEREIGRVLLRYCRGVDRGDAEMIRDCYHPGAVDVHGRYSGDGPAFGDYAVGVLTRRYAATTHHIGAPLIELDGDSAHVDTYVVAYHLSVDPLGQAHLYVFGGRYVDRFSRRDGRWRIDARAVVRDWTIRHPVPPDALHRELEEAKSFALGRRDREDLGYPDAYSRWLKQRFPEATS